jgi:type VI secretion system protein ImpE
MTSKELLEAGKLDDAIQAVTQDVKARPSESGLRVFLFELLCLKGDLDRASKQLDVLAAQGSGLDSDLAIQIYRDLITAERARRAVFHDGGLPKFFLPPPPHLDHYVMLVTRLTEAPAEAVALLAAAEEQCPAVGGNIGGRPFSAFRDADDRVAPVLEVFHNGSYLWLPFDQIRRIEVSEPRTLRDTVWAHAKVETYESSVGDVFVPTCYVDTHLHANDHVRLGRLTEWQAVDDQLVYGAGQRVFLVDDEDVSILDLRNVEFTVAAPEASAS